MGLAPRWLVIVAKGRFWERQTAWVSLASIRVDFLEHCPTLAIRTDAERKNYKNASVCAAYDLVNCKSHKDLLKRPLAKCYGMDASV